MAKEDYVVYLVDDGNGGTREVSNDPRWLAKQAADADSDGVDDDDEVGPYDHLKGAELKTEVARRNEGRDEADQIDVSGMTKKSEYIAALEADDAKTQG